MIDRYFMDAAARQADRATAAADALVPSREQPAWDYALGDVLKRYDAIGRRLPADWLRGCAQAREARLIAAGEIEHPEAAQARRRPNPLPQEDTL